MLAALLLALSACAADLSGPLAPVWAQLKEAPAPPAPPAEAQKDPLLERLMAMTRFAGPPEEKAFYEKLCARLLESPTGRELALSAVSQDAPVAVAFEDFPGTDVYERSEGVLAFAGSHAAHAVRTEDSLSVALNRLCLKVDPSVAGTSCVEQLAHELFGHGLGWLEARGAARRSYWVYDDEFLARLVGWNVRLDLTGAVRDPEAFCAAEDPAAFQRRLPSVYPSCQWALTRSELRDPEASMRARLGWAQDKAAREALAGALASIAGEAGRQRREAMKAAAEDPVFDRLEARFEKLRARLLAHEGVLRAAPLCSDYR